MNQAKLIFLFIILIAFVPTRAQEFLRGSMYYDSRNFNTLTVEGQSNIGKCQIFAFVDFYTNGANYDFVNAYGEVKIGIKIYNQLRLLYEYNDGKNLAVNRLGFQIDISSSWLKKIRILPYTSNTHTGQISTSIYWTNNKFYLNNFFDLNIDYQTGKLIYITEALFGYKVTKKISLVIEIESNNFTNREVGIAPGIEINF